MLRHIKMLDLDVITAILLSDISKLNKSLHSHTTSEDKRAILFSGT